MKGIKLALWQRGTHKKKVSTSLTHCSPIAKLVSVKLLLALATIYGWSLNQLDITNAFLHGNISKEVYMTLPPGYTCGKGESLPSNVVCRLYKFIYGVKQASWQWFHKFSSALISEGSL